MSPKQAPRTIPSKPWGFGKRGHPWYTKYYGVFFLEMVPLRIEIPLPSEKTPVIMKFDRSYLLVA